MQLFPDAPAPACPVTLLCGPDIRLTCEEVESAGVSPHLDVALTPDAVREMKRSHSLRLRSEDAGEPIYGVTTGFGPFVRYGAGEGESHGAGLLAHLGVGCGPASPKEVVRAAMVLRAHTLSQGWSGVSPALVEVVFALLEAGITPVVPEVGSVGASGDLVPLAHMARALAGEGESDYCGRTVPTAFALEAAGLKPYRLDGREALSLTNGVSFLTAWAALGVARAERLIAHAESLTGWLYRTLGCRASALDPRLHRARGHIGQVQSAANIRDEAARFGPWEDGTRPLQEVYSLRCAPQVLGACRENLCFARRIVETEINGVDDNPLFAEEDDPAVLHGGNFHGQQVAFAADALNAALVQVGLLLERQMDVLLNPALNGGASLLLAWEPGPDSGLAGVQLTATALAAEMRVHAQAHATATIPTNGGNQDIVSMGALAARMSYAQTGRLATLLALTSLAASRLNSLKERGRAPGNAAMPPQNFPEFVEFAHDIPLGENVARTAAMFLNLLA